MSRRVVRSVLLATLLMPRIAAAGELEDLLRVLAEETDLATRTKMNRDYVPGMITVLEGDTLEALGCRNVLDALSLVPGMQAFRELSGAPNLSIRGIAFPFNAGNTKVLINSVAISREDAGINSAALLTPIEQVERIEIVRGPSSSLHGAFAFAGLINVVTRDRGGRVFATATNGGGVAGGYYASDIGNWQLALNSAPYTGEEGEGPVGLDPHAHGSTSVLRLSHEGFSITAQHLRRNQEITGQQALERSTGIEARQRFAISPAVSGEARVDLLDDEFRSASVGQRFKGSVFEAATTLQWKASRRHNVLADLSFARSHIDRAQLTLVPLLRTDIRDINRDFSALTLQDQIELGSRLTLTLGLRGDHYEDVGDRITPRAGVVYRASDNHIFKAQYAEGFRPPTFWELYAPGHLDTNLGFESMRTTELGYVYRRTDLVARLTLFRSKIDDMLFLVLPPPTLPTYFANNTSARMHGAEGEVEWQKSERLRLIANVSHVSTEDGRITSSPSGDSAAAADWLANLAAILRPSPRTIVGARLLHVGERHTITGTTDGYDSLDVTTSLAVTPEWTVRAGVHNLLDDDVTYLLAYPNATAIVNFASRTGFVTISRRF